MATRKIVNKSSGIYTREIDLTVVQKSAGTFAGASLGLTEKGPAFEIMTSADFTERAMRLGDLNPAFKSSYFAREFLDQANNYKEVRLLGLEGYNEEPIIVGSTNTGGYDKCFAILYKVSGASAAGTPNIIIDCTGGTDPITVTIPKDLSLVAGATVIIDGVTGNTAANGQFFIANIDQTDPNETSFDLEYPIGTPVTGNGNWLGGGIVKPQIPLIASQESIACILKTKRTSFTQYAEVDYVKIEASATDELFTLTVYFKGNQQTYPPISVKCSLRPESNQYVGNVFGLDPKGVTKIAGVTSPLWVEFIYPSKETKLKATGVYGYFYPGETNPETAPLTSLELVSGNITVQKGFVYPSFRVTGVNTGGGEIEFTTNINHGFVINELINVVNIDGIVKAGTSTPLDGNWYVKATNTLDTFTIKDVDGNVPAVTGTFIQQVDSFAKKAFVVTWESEVMDLGGAGQEIEFQTPITPWFVSDFNENGETKRLFRLWSISDGETANVEIKAEVSNFNPDGNNGKGSFDIYLRSFSDTEDGKKTIVEGFANLTLDPKSDNYVARRIGDGEDFQLKSRYVFVEMYIDDDVPNNALPYGVEGYANLYNIKAPDVAWTTQYDLGKSLNKQILGLANNNINMFSAVTNDNLSYKNILGEDSVGLGFHLNPQFITVTSNPTLYSILSASFKLADAESFNVSLTNETKVSGTDKVKRMKYVVDFFGGFDGWNVYADRTWGTTTSKDWEVLNLGLEILSDVESLDADFSVLVTPDFNFEDDSTAAEAVLEMVEDRGDAIYLFDFRYTGADAIDAEMAKTALIYSNMLSSFSATYYPDVQMEDEKNKINPWLPPSIVALATIASTATNENVWQPPAGSIRTVTERLVRTRKRMRLDDREVLKSANINPITLFPGSGFEITESRTTQSVFSALSFIHNRLLLGYAKKALNQSLRPILHQLKTEALKDAFISAVEPIFERIKKANGLETFTISATGEDEDRTTLHGKIEIVPLYPVERIIVDFVLKNGELDFNNQ